MVKKIFYWLLFKSSYYKWLVDNNLKRALEMQWNLEFSNPIRWNNPETLNEKIQWLQLNTDTSKWTEYADKYEVRSYYIKMGFEEYLPKLLGVWDNVEDIDWESLPNKYVIKCTHDSHSTIIIDKGAVDIKLLKKKLRNKLNRKFGYRTCEPHYTKIKPRIIVEELLPNIYSSISSSLIDYKILCFNGKPSYIWAAYNRKHDSVYVNLYDLNWNQRSDYDRFTNLYRDGKGLAPRPQSLNKMIEIASVLSKGFPEVRIDFYDMGSKPVIGEMTFTNACGRIPFFSDEGQYKMGQMIKLPNIYK